MSVISLGSNIASLKAQRRLAEGTGALGTSFERLASGLRINRASDDAAGLAIASALSSDARVFNQALRNVNDGISLLNITEGALSQLSLITTRQKELAEQAANGVYSLQQRRALDAEANALGDEYNRIVDSVTFNGLNTLSLKDLRIQAGFGLDGSLSFGLGRDLSRTVSDGNFDQITQIAGPMGSANIWQADLNGDGLADLVTQEASGIFSAMLGNGDGTFRRAGTFFILSPQFSRVEDVDGDGIADIVAAGTTSMRFLLGNGDGSFRISPHQISGQSHSFVAGDVNGDGITDVVRFQSSNFHVFLGTASGAFLSPATYEISEGHNFDSSLSSLKDLNGDGVLDLIHSTPSSNSLFISFGNGNGSFRAEVFIELESSPFGEAIVKDFNHDGVPDILQPDGDGFSLLIGNGDGTFKAAARQFEGTGFVIEEAADIDGDGRLDLTARLYGTSQMFILYGNGNGTFRAGNQFTAAQANGFGSVVGDFNNDGVPDIATSTNTTGGVSIVRSGTMLEAKTAQLDLLSQNGAKEALVFLTGQLTRISNELGSIGSSQSRLSVALDNLRQSREEYIAARSRITDVDVATESAELTRRNILQQVTAAVLAQANQAPSVALRVLTG